MLQITIPLALAAAYLFSGLRMMRAPQWSASTALLSILALLALHAIWLWVELTPSTGRLSIAHAAALVSLGFAISAVISSRMNHGITLAGLLAGVSGTALIISAAALVWLDQPLAGSAQSGWPLLAHILFSLVAYVLCAIAAVVAVLMALKERQIRTNQVRGLIGALPSLMTLEHVLFGALGIGFVVLSLSMFSGLIFIDDIKAQHLTHKTILTALGWLVFGTLLFGRWRFGWRGRVAVRWTLTGFIFLGLAYFGSRLVLEQLLGRSWG